MHRVLRKVLNDSVVGVGLFSNWEYLKSNYFQMNIRPCYDLVCLFNSISTFVGYWMLKPSKMKNNNDTIESIRGGDIGVHIFFKDANLIMNVLARLVLELVYYGIVVQDVCHYATGDYPLYKFEISLYYHWVYRYTNWKKLSFFR